MVKPQSQVDQEIPQVETEAQPVHGIGLAAQKIFGIQITEKAGPQKELVLKEALLHPQRHRLHFLAVVEQVALGQRDHIEVFGDDYPTRDGTNIRDYVHVYDLARAHLLAMETIADRDVIYNLGSESGYSNKEVFATAEKVVGRKLPLKVGPRRPGEPQTGPPDRPWQVSANPSWQAPCSWGWTAT